ncbi:unnamed protein product [Cochlearia groenlandica]
MSKVSVNTTTGLVQKSTRECDICCRLTDQEYLELVFENGQIIAKSQISKSFVIKNPRTKSIMELYEEDYNDDLKKSIHTSGGFINNNIGDITQLVVPKQHIVSTYETNMLENNNNDEPTCLPPDEHSVISQKFVSLGFESTDFTEDSEVSAYLSSSLDDDESNDVSSRVPPKTRKDLVKKRRRRSKEQLYYNSPERKQINDINKKMRTLHDDLLPNSHKGTMGNKFVRPTMMLPLGLQYYSHMGLLPQFLHASVLGAGLPRINHLGLMPMPNSALFTPTDDCSQFVPPWCATSPNQDDATMK